MVKFTASSGDIIIIGLGLEEENIKRMKAGEPIKVKLSDLGFEGVMGAVDIVIFTGKDLISIKNMLKPMIGPDTVIHKE